MNIQSIINFFRECLNFLWRLAGPFITGYINTWRKYADADGRARRSEYLSFFIVNGGLLYLCNKYIDPATGVGFFFILLFALFIPALSVTERRLHDTGRRRSIWMRREAPLFLLYEDSQPRENEWGPSPKYGKKE
ncbi:MAG: DUF805 domain-containing protein [Dehalococcoidales bacterium]|nr:DUF805 domain-containing protein [Dehalococcoidales bacterium]